MTIQVRALGSVAPPLVSWCFPAHGLPQQFWFLRRGQDDGFLELGDLFSYAALPQGASEFAERTLAVSVVQLQ
jgi:hypothetical protein